MRLESLLDLHLALKPVAVIHLQLFLSSFLCHLLLPLVLLLCSAQLLCKYIMLRLEVLLLAKLILSLRSCKVFGEALLHHQELLNLLPHGVELRSWLPHAAELRSWLHPSLLKLRRNGLEVFRHRSAPSTPHFNPRLFCTNLLLLPRAEPMV